jgi:hypothetical protein
VGSIGEALKAIGEEVGRIGTDGADIRKEARVHHELWIPQKGTKLDFHIFMRKFVPVVSFASFFFYFDSVHISQLNVKCLDSHRYI